MRVERVDDLNQIDGDQAAYRSNAGAELVKSVCVLVGVIVHIGAGAGRRHVDEHLIDARLGQSRKVTEGAVADDGEGQTFCFDGVDERMNVRVHQGFAAAGNNDAFHAGIDQFAKDAKKDGAFHPLCLPRSRFGERQAGRVIPASHAIEVTGVDDVDMHGFRTEANFLLQKTQQTLPLRGGERAAFHARSRIALAAAFAPLLRTCWRAQRARALRVAGSAI